MADPINPSPRLYGELAAWWPLLSDPGDYVEEATFYQTQLLAACDGEAHTLLELGSSGGKHISASMAGEAQLLTARGLHKPGRARSAFNFQIPPPS